MGNTSGKMLLWLCAQVDLITKLYKMTSSGNHNLTFSSDDKLGRIPNNSTPISKHVGILLMVIFIFVMTMVIIAAHFDAFNSN